MQTAHQTYHKEFFPTPAPVIAKMLAPYGLHHGRRILEPSAGKGDIANYLHNVEKVNKHNIYCIEIEPDLQAILQQNGYRVIDSDFLSFSDPYHFDLIVMNPPFSNGATHLLKAWDVLRAGDIVCLLNAETVRNAWSGDRQVLARIIEQHGEVVEMGQCFDSAERRTDVEVVMVRLHKEAEETVINFDGTYEGETFRYDNADYVNNAVAQASMIDALVAQYNMIRRLIVERNDINKKIVFFTPKRPDKHSMSCSAERAVVQGEIKRGHNRYGEATVADQLDDLKTLFWRHVFDVTQIGRKTTSHFQEKFDEFAAQQQNMAFTGANIRQVLGFFVMNQAAIMQECIDTTFDTATAYHKKNTVHHEGWKTNSSYRCNKRIIVPGGVLYDWYGFTFNHYRSKTRDFYQDLDKVMCWLSGKQEADIVTVESALRTAFDQIKAGEDYQQPFYSTFFKLRFYKKGTLHIDFLDLDLLADFNRRAAEGKNWVGGGY